MYLLICDNIFKLTSFKPLLEPFLIASNCVCKGINDIIMIISCVCKSIMSGGFKHQIVTFDFHQDLLYVRGQPIFHLQN